MLYVNYGSYQSIGDRNSRINNKLKRSFRTENKEKRRDIKSESIKAFEAKTMRRPSERFHPPFMCYQSPREDVLPTADVRLCQRRKF